MAISEYAAGSEAITTSLHSMSTDTSGPDAQTADGVYQAFLDLSDMVTGDQLLVILTESAGNGSRVIYEVFLYGPQATPIWVSPTFVLTAGWDWTLYALAGTITVDWSIRQIT